MNFKTTVTLLLLLAVSAGVLFFVRREKAGQPETPKERKLVDMEMKDVVGVTVTTADGKKLAIEQSGIFWKMLEPVAAPADTITSESLIRALTDLKSRGVVEATGQDAKATGLDKPRFTVEVRGKDGKSTKLKVGERSTVGGNLYVQVDGDPKPRLVAADFSDQLEKPHTDFRQKKLVSMSPADIRQIEITRPDVPKIVLHRAGENWQIVEPQAMPGDGPEIQNVVTAIAGMHAQEFVNENDVPPFLRPKSNPAATIWYAKEAPATQPATQPASRPAGESITFGGYENVMKKNVYVAVTDPPALAKVPGNIMDSFDKTAMALRDRNVIKIEKNEVESITIKTDKPATTQPTTKPAVNTTLKIVRNKTVPAAPWHAPFAVPGQADATTQPSSQPSTAPATGPAVAATSPATAPATQASTKPAGPPPPKWEITSTDPKTAADESAVDGLLAAFAPLRVEKFVEASPTTQPSDQYTLTISTPSAVHTMAIVDPGDSKNLICEYNGLRFEVTRFFLDKVTAKFDAASAATAREHGPGGHEHGAPPGLNPMP